MDDIELAIHAAWDRVRDDVLADRDELRRRVIRRERPHVGRPIREWCLAVMARDRRLAEPLVAVEPAGASEPGRNGGDVAAHDVTLTTAALRKLCAPVVIDGMTLDQAAEKLGVHPMNLVHARIKGTLRADYIEGLGGYWGKPRPVLYADAPLNPTKRGFGGPDGALGYTASFCAQRVPEGIRQTIARVPIEIPRGPDYRDRRGLHPEHPLNDPGDGKPRKSNRLPRPPPNVDLCAWYKWKGDEYLGYDWRNPRAKANYERHQRKKAMAREAQRRWRRERPRPSKSKGSIEFRGWRWLCPRCGKRVQVLFYPLPAINLLEQYPRDRAALRRAGVRAMPPPPRVTGFACAGCHRVRVLSRAARVQPFWNDLIAHLTGGLLYGREVERPAWLTNVRKVAYAPRPNCAPAHRRLAVQERLLKGWSYKRIAADMGISPGTVDRHAQAIYRQHRVHGRWELVKHLGIDLPLEARTKRQQIGARLARGETYKEIAAAMRLTRHGVTEHARRLRGGATGASRRSARRSSPHPCGSGRR